MRILLDGQERANLAEVVHRWLPSDVQAPKPL